MFIQALCNQEKILLNTKAILYIERVPSIYPYSPYTVYVTFQYGETTKRAIVKKNELRCSIETPFSNEESINWLSEPLPSNLIHTADRINYL